MKRSARLTEETVRDLSTAKSFERGQDLYESGAISDTYRQGNTVFATCEGSSAPFYTLHAAVADGKVSTAACDCPYDFGGLCKHLIALLLTYIHEPEQFEERQTVRELVKDLDRDTLINLLEQLAGNDARLQDRIERLAAAGQTGTDRATGKPAQPKSLSKISDKSIRRQIKSILRGPLSERYSDQYWMMDRLVSELNQLHGEAVNSLEAGDPATALVMLMTLLEETAGAYEMLDDSDGEIDNFLEEVSESLSEAILSQGLPDQDREMLEKRLKPLADDLLEYGIEGPAMALDALEQGWGAAVSLDDDEDETSDLTDVKLNILERQGRIDDFLALCLAEGNYWRYVYKLLELGRKDEALRVAEERLTTPSEMYALAQNLAQRGDIQDALTIGERLLSAPERLYYVPGWLAILAEAAGRMDLALRAYRETFLQNPSIDLYHKLRELAGDTWEQLKPELMARLATPDQRGVLLDINMDERNWDAAIQIADQGGWHVADRLPALVDAVLKLHPEWVIKVCQVQADQWIDKGTGKAYAEAASWLRTVKQAYTLLGRQDEWRTYLRDLKLQYPRRRVLQAELAKL